MSMRRKNAVVGLLVCCTLACGPIVKHPAPLPDRPTLSSDTPLPEYTIERGDELGIRFFYDRDLDETVRVRPDGRISLRLIPEVVAWGKTARELGELLGELYSKELAQPEITVIVKTFSAQRIFVTGEVGKPGQIDLVGATTVSQAVAEAGGQLDTARLNEVIVIRRNPDRTPRVMLVNLKAAMKGEDPKQDIDLQPYDVVYLPKSHIADVNKFIDQYVRLNIPVSFGFRIDIVP